ncbi:MAG: hypothetical protein KA419_18460 [Acidobacteria bacterium]|nr:hypothetical protein [Acidobacteriota bacterium]
MPLKSDHFSEDIRDFMLCLDRTGVRYVLLGGEAVIYYGHARLTGDTDFFYDIAEDNAQNLFRALRLFWRDNIPGVKAPSDLQVRGQVIQFGRPPNRIDLVNAVSGISFQEAWSSRREESLCWEGGNCRVFIIGLEPLMRNKQAAGRGRDLDDLRYLRKLSTNRPRH